MVIGILCVDFPIFDYTVGLVFIAAVNVDHHESDDLGVLPQAKTMIKGVFVAGETLARLRRK